MALADIRHNPDVAEAELQALSGTLHAVAADALNTNEPGGELGRDDVEVYFTPNGPYDRTNGVDFLILVHTDPTPRRLDRARMIAMEIGSRAWNRVAATRRVMVYIPAIGGFYDSARDTSKPRQATPSSQ